MPEIPQTSVTEPKGHGSIMVLAAGGLGLYLFAYLILLALGYFDLATLPWKQQQNDWLYRAFWPLEWLRHLWH